MVLKETILLTASSNRGIGFWTSICFAFSRFFGCKCRSYNVKVNRAIEDVKKKLNKQMDDHPEYTYSDFRIVKENSISFLGSVLGTIKPEFKGIDVIDKKQQKPALQSNFVNETSSVDVPSDKIIVGSEVEFINDYHFKRASGVPEIAYAGSKGTIQNVKSDTLFDVSYINSSGKKLILASVDISYLKKIK